MAKRHSKSKRESNARVSDKIKVLMDSGEAKNQRQAVAEALSMERAGRLHRGGVYVRKGRGKRSRPTSGRG